MTVFILRSIEGHTFFAVVLSAACIYSMPENGVVAQVLKLSAKVTS